MSQSNPNSEDLANAIIAHETLGIRASDAKVPPGCLAIEKIRPHLAALMGNAGFSALLNRARALGSSNVPWLGELPVKLDGSLEVFYAVGKQVEADDFQAGCIVLLSQLLGLLATFIGQDLTLQLIQGVWPELSLGDLNVGKGNNNEKRK